MKNAIIVLCIAAVLFSGCSAPQEGAKETKDDTGKEVSGEKGATQSTQAASGSEDSGGLLNDLKSLVSLRPLQYMVDYKTETSMGGEQETDGRMAMYYKGEDKVRTDTWMGDIESRYIMSGGEVVMCNKQAGEWSCMRMSQAEDRETEINRNMEELEDNLDTSEVAQLPDRVVAGAKCKCFRIKIKTTLPDAQKAGLSEWDHVYCISPEGVPLYSESTSEKTRMVMEATRYSTTVSDSEFIPPAEPKDMMEMMGGGGSSRPSDRNPPEDAQDVPSEDMPGSIPQIDCSICDRAPDEEARDSCRNALNCA